MVKYLLRAVLRISSLVLVIYCLRRISDTYIAVIAYFNILAEDGKGSRYKEDHRDNSDRKNIMINFVDYGSGFDVH